MNIYGRFLWLDNQARAKKYPNATPLTEQFEISIFLSFSVTFVFDALPTGFNIADIFSFVILGDSTRIPTMSSFIDAVLSHKSPSFTSLIRNQVCFAKMSVSGVKEVTSNIWFKVGLDSGQVETP
jgi:hypothetical protein